jgi:uridine kinase
VGPREVRFDALERSLGEILDGRDEVEKPLVLYGEDRVTTETVDLRGVKVAIAEGTYTTLLRNVNTRIFIARTREDTRAHREKRVRHESELDEFVDRVLEIEHGIISKHMADADIVITRDYDVVANG